MRLRIAVCDSRRTDREELSAALERELSARNVEFATVQYDRGEFLLWDLEESQDIHFDLIFIDCLLSGMSGMDVIRQIRRSDRTVSVIIVSASPDYAREGHEVNAIAYLLKPLDEGRLSAALDLFFEDRRINEGEYLQIGERGAERRVRFGDIQYITIHAHYVTVQTTQGKMEFYGTILEMESRLPKPNFLKCNRGCIINMDYVESVDKDFVMSDGAVIPIKVRERKEIREQYYRYVLDQQ